MDHVDQFIEIQMRSSNIILKEQLIRHPWTNLHTADRGFFHNGNPYGYEGYYSMLLHELTNWTGSKAHLNCEGGKKFGDQHYVIEELVAKLGAAFMCAEFGIGVLEKGDHADISISG